MAAALCAAAAERGPAEAELRARLPEIFAKSAAHYKALDAAATPLMKDADGNMRYPHGFKRDTRELKMHNIRAWTAGHFPGSLWYIYEATGDEAIRDRALFWTELLAPNSKVTSNHDVGFIMYCSYGNARRLLKTDRYDALLAETADQDECHYGNSQEQRQSQQSHCGILDCEQKHQVCQNNISTQIGSECH